MKLKKFYKNSWILKNSKVCIIESSMEVPTLYLGDFGDLPASLLDRELDFISSKGFENEDCIRLFVCQEVNTNVTE